MGKPLAPHSSTDDSSANSSGTEDMAKAASEEIMCSYAKIWDSIPASSKDSPTGSTNMAAARLRRSPELHACPLQAGTPNIPPCNIYVISPFSSGSHSSINGGRILSIYGFDSRDLFGGGGIPGWTCGAPLVTDERAGCTDQGSKNLISSSEQRVSAIR